MFEESTLGAPDILFIVGSLSITVLIGLYFANKNKTFADYARGGGNQNLWAVSASMAAGYCSALTLIGNPSELYMHGTSFTLTMATTILASPIAALIFLPVFRRLDGISIFQYIELRFSARLRRFVSLLFAFQMTFYSAVSLYLPSLPLYTTLKIPQTLSIGFIGLMCIVYSSFGGLKAVTWTNLYHTLLLLTTMLAILVVGVHQSGGLQQVLEASWESGRFSLGADYLQWDLTTRHTLYNTLLGYTLVRLFLHGTSQMQVQSALSLSSMRKSQASQLISAIFYFALQCLASAIGFLLLVNYRHCDPHLNGQIQRQDELLMHYLHRRLNDVPMLQGLFIAAIFGSTLTTMSSYLSSTSAMLVEDFVRPLYRLLLVARARRRRRQGQRNAKMTHNDIGNNSNKNNNKQQPVKLDLELSESHSALMGKLISVLLGCLSVLLTFEMGKINGLQQATTTIYGVVGIPILSAFALGTMTKFVTTPAMFAGMLASISFGVYIFIGHLLYRPLLEPSLPISTAGCPAGLAEPLNQTDSLKLLAATDSSSLSDLFVPIYADERQNDTLTGGLAAIVNTEDSNFQLARMSYLWLPLFTMGISVLVASSVSLLTGGLSQEVSERFLAPGFKWSALKLPGRRSDKSNWVDVAGKCSSCGHVVQLGLKQDSQKMAAIGLSYAERLDDAGQQLDLGLSSEKS